MYKRQEYRVVVLPEPVGPDVRIIPVSYTHLALTEAAMMFLFSKKTILNTIFLLKRVTAKQIQNTALMKLSLTAGNFPKTIHTKFKIAL